MTWLIIGDLLGLFALLPALYRALIKLEDSLDVIDQNLTDIVAECKLIVPALDGVAKLAETQMLTGAGSFAIVRYTDELQPLVQSN